MRVLFISKIPYPLNTGANIRTYNLIKVAGSLCDVDLICPVFSEIEREGLATMRRLCCDVKVVDSVRDSKWVRYSTGLKNLLASSKPYMMDSYISKELVAAVDGWLQKKGYSAVHVDSIALSLIITKLENRQNNFFVLNEHNVESTILKRYLALENQFLKKQYYTVQYERLKKWEKRVCHSYDRVITVSKRDKTVLEDEFEAENVQVVQNGVDTCFFRASGATEPIKNSIVFCGSMDWKPNIDAVEFFIRDCLPHLKEKMADISFTIVGRNPPEHIVMMAGDAGNCTVTGTVDDVRPYIEKAMVFAVPLRIGGGSRLKILEAMSMGKPVISTTIGAEGLHVSHGKEIIIADGPITFAEECFKLLQDEKKRDELARQGHECVISSYGWETLGRDLVAAWKR